MFKHVFAAECNNCGTGISVWSHNVHEANIYFAKCGWRVAGSAGDRLGLDYAAIEKSSHHTCTLCCAKLDREPGYSLNAVEVKLEQKE